MITQAAIKDTNGKVWTLPRPNRHGHIVEYMHNNKPDYNAKDARRQGQGFIDEKGNFYNRIEAWTHAIECKQLFYIYDPNDSSKKLVDPNPSKTGGLCSEDLW